MASKLFTVAVESYSRAVILKSLLEEEGISCILSNVNIIQPDASSGVKIKVNEEDLEKAIEIAKRLKSDKASEAVYAKKKGSTRIIVPVDFSDYSRNASFYALHIAGKYQESEIQLLYVYYTPDMATIPYSETYFFSEPVSKQIQEIKEQSEEKMDHLIKELSEESDKCGFNHVKVNYNLVQGTPSDSILYFSESYMPDLIVVGARGAGSRKDFMGSSSIKVVLKAQFPVLVVPENSVFDEKKKEYNIVYATNYDEADFIAITKLMKLMDAFKIRIYCTHIGSPTDERWEEMKMEGLKKYFSGNYPKVKIHCSTLEEDDIISGLEKMVSEKSIDIISLITHRRNLLTQIINPSIAKKVFYHTDLPLFVFHTGVKN